MAHQTEFRMQQKAMFFRRIQVILIGVVAVSVLEHSAKRNEQLQADRAKQNIAKTSQRKATVQAVTTPPKPLATPPGTEIAPQQAKLQKQNPPSRVKNNS